MSRASPSPLPLNPGELLQHRADRSGVLAAAALRDARIVELHRSGEERRWAMEVGGEFTDDVEVLQMRVHRRCWLVVFSRDHHRPTDLKHVRGAGAVGDDVKHERRIESGHLAEHKGFGRRQIVNGDKMVGDELHPATVAEGTDIFLGARYAGEHFAAALESRFVTAGEDNEVLSGRLAAAAAHRTVELDLALRPEPPLPAALHLHRQGAAFDDDLALPIARG